MVKEFYNDLRKAQAAEQLVLETFSGLTADYTFYSVGDQREYFHKGDIKAIAADGTEIMIEVKDDSRIGDTRNILCEESVFYFDSEETKPGNFYSDYEIYTVVSQPERKIYVFDFSILKQIYKKYGERKILRHYDQESEVYLLPLGAAKSKGALIKEIDY